MVKSLDSVAATESFNMKLRMTAVNLEGEYVFPFCATHMKPSGLTAGCSQSEERIVVCGHLPEICRQMSVDRHEIAEKPAGQIDKMNTLVNQFAASGQFWIGPPFFFVAEASAVAVACANKHQLSQGSGLKYLARLLKSGMITVVVADANTQFSAFSFPSQRFEL